MLNAVLCKSCGNYIHGRCAKIKRVTNRLAIVTVTELSYLGDRINSGGGCVAAVTSRTRLGWVRFRECQDLLCRKKFPLKIKGIVSESCMRSAVLYGSETWSLGQNWIGILPRTERAMVGNMCGMKLMDIKSTKDLMQMLDLNETIDQLAKVNSVRWHGQVLTKDKNHFLRRALDFKVKGTMK